MNQRTRLSKLMMALVWALTLCAWRILGFDRERVIL